MTVFTIAAILNIVFLGMLFLGIIVTIVAQFTGKPILPEDKMEAKADEIIELLHCIVSKEFVEEVLQNEQDK